MPSKNGEVARFIEIDRVLAGAFPHLHGFFVDEEDYRGLSIKPRPDGTFLAVAMGCSSDGSPMVCFGQGYGVVGALFGLDRSLQAGSWKVDKFAN